MTDANRARTDQQDSGLVDGESYVPPGMIGEFDSTKGLAQRGLSTSERELMLVDRIVVLENKLAELQHKYKMTTDGGGYRTPPALVEPPLRFQRARDTYSLILQIPAIGRIAHRAVGVAKKARAARRDG